MRRTVLATCLLLISVSTRAEPPAAEAVRMMVEAEKKFYETGQEKGTRAAFLEFLAEDGIVFRPGPVNGKEVWGKRDETGLDLVWEPTFAVIARSADFGYDTGPAKWRANKKEEKFTGHGQFISIWKKQQDGSWKVALDCGIENPEPTGKPETLRTVVPSDPKTATDLNAAQVNRWDAQQKFAEAAKRDSAMATMAFAAPDIRIYRDGHFPLIGKAASKLLDATAGRVTFEMLGADMSRSADLSYTYGKYSKARPKGTEPGGTSIQVPKGSSVLRLQPVREESQAGGGHSDGDGAMPCGLCPGGAVLGRSSGRGGVGDSASEW